MSEILKCPFFGPLLGWRCLGTSRVCCVDLYAHWPCFANRLGFGKSVALRAGWVGADLLIRWVGVVTQVVAAGQHMARESCWRLFDVRRPCRCLFGHAETSVSLSFCSVTTGIEIGMELPSWPVSLEITVVTRRTHVNTLLLVLNV
jgi:hypothetical protein